MLAYYRNETLFSEIYLEEITRQPEQAEVLASLKVLREYRAYADTASLEAWKKTYIHEVLAALGFNAQSKKAGLTKLNSPTVRPSNSARPLSRPTTIWASFI